MMLKESTYLEKYFLHVAKERRDHAAIAYLASLDHLQEHAPEVVSAITQELKDQRNYLKLIASENYSSLSTQLAMGNLLTDKYSEGYVHHRFYAGCENVDTVEQMATDVLKKIFQCEHAYVQPHSGADANLVAFWAVLTKRIQSPKLEELQKKNIEALTAEEYEQLRQVFLDQRLLGMSLSSGGHLTHGYRHNISSKIFQAFSYDVDPTTERLDYENLRRQVQDIKPAILIAGYSSYPRRINFAKMKEIAEEVGATLMVDMAHFAGLVAGKAFTGEEDPIPFADIVTSTTHKTMRGPRGGMVLCKEEYGSYVDKGCPYVLGGPLPHVMAAKAVAFQEANHPSFCQYAEQVVANARALAEQFLRNGVKLFTGGTDNHLVVLKVAESFGMTGRGAELLLREAHMTVNRNMIPFDQNGPWYTSGIRIGTPALTTRGLKEKEMQTIANLITKLLKAASAEIMESGKPSKSKWKIDPKILTGVREEVAELLGKFPLYPELEIV